MRNEVVVRNDSARKLFPDIHPRDYGTSLERALARIAADEVETSWSDAQVSALGDVVPVTLTTREGLLLEERQRKTSAEASLVYRIFTGLGKIGLVVCRLHLAAAWYSDRLWAEGFSPAGATPMSCGGDALDFWRVETLEPDRMMRLRAEMKSPVWPGCSSKRFHSLPGVTFDPDRL
jgi:hypothetical protein